MYTDRSMIVWDLSKKPATQFKSLPSHAGPVWDLALLPSASSSTPSTVKRRAFADIDYDSDEEERAQAEAAKRMEGRLPEGTFATCSSDNTIKLWNLNTNAPSSSSINSDINGVRDDTSLAAVSGSHAGSDRAVSWSEKDAATV